MIDVPKMDIPRALVSSRWPLSAFTRLYAGKLLPDSIDKILGSVQKSVGSPKISRSI